MAFSPAYSINYNVTGGGVVLAKIMIATDVKHTQKAPLQHKTGLECVSCRRLVLLCCLCFFPRLVY